MLLLMQYAAAAIQQAAVQVDCLVMQIKAVELQWQVTSALLLLNHKGFNDGMQ